MKTFTYEELKNVDPEDPILLEEGNVIVTLSEIRQCKYTAYIELALEFNTYTPDGIGRYVKEFCFEFFLEDLEQKGHFELAINADPGISFKYVKEEKL